MLSSRLLISFYKHVLHTSSMLDVVNTKKKKKWTSPLFSRSYLAC